MQESRGLTTQFNRLGIDNEQFGPVQAYVAADIPSQQRMLFSRIVANQKDGRRAGHITHGGGGILLSGNGARKSGKVGGAVMVNAIGGQHGAGKLLQQIILFIGGAVGTDDANCTAAFEIANLLQPFGYMLQRFFPGGGNEGPIPANQRLTQPAGMIEEIKSVAALDAEEVAIDTAFIAIVAAHNVHTGIGAADAESGRASIATMSADGANVLHLPRAGFIAISP